MWTVGAFHANLPENESCGSGFPRPLWERVVTYIKQGLNHSQPDFLTVTYNKLILVNACSRHQIPVNKFNGAWLQLRRMRC